MEVAISLSYIVSTTPSVSQLLCSTVEFFTQETVLHKLLEHGFPMESCVPLGAPAQVSHGITALFRHSPALTCSSMGCRCTVCLTMDHRELSAPVSGAPPSSSSPTLVSAELFLLRILTPLFWLLLVLHRCIFPASQICYHRRATTVTDGWQIFYLVTRPLCYTEILTQW